MCESTITIPIRMTKMTAGWGTLLPTRSTPSSTFSMNVFGAALALTMRTILSQHPGLLEATASAATIMGRGSTAQGWGLPRRTQGSDHRSSGPWSEAVKRARTPAPGTSPPGRTRSSAAAPASSSRRSDSRPGPITIRFTGVATGVRKDAAAATATLISTGCGEMPSWRAAATAIGMMIRAVAVLLISWPRIAGQQEQAGQQRVGAGIADEPHQRLAEHRRGPALIHRGRQRHHGADHDDRRPVDRPIGLLHRDDAQQDHGAGGEQARHRRGAPRPVARSSTIAASTASACLAPGPMGIACRRTSSGESTTSTSGPTSRSSSAFQVPCSSSVSPARSSISLGPSGSPLRCTRQDDEVAARGDHAREYGLPDHSRTAAG